MFANKGWTKLFLSVLLVCSSIMVFPTIALAQKSIIYDVIVVGSEPEGVAAALSAARNGARTLLVTKDRIVGGTITLANLITIDMNYGPDGELLTRGIFEEFYRQVQGDSFDLERARKVFLSLITQEENLTVLYKTKIIKALFEKDRKTLKGLEIEKKKKKEVVYGKRLIDATGDADLAALAGVPYTIGKEDLNLGKQIMAPTLVFQVGGVDWSAIAYYLRRENSERGKTSNLSGANACSAWGYSKEMRNYLPLDPKIKVRGLNMGRQNDGSIMINAMLIFEVDPLNRLSVNSGLERGKKEAKRIVQYLRENAYGFQDAYLMGTAEKLYIRESRHIIGQYQLDIDDVLGNKNFPDKIALGSYPVDVQASNKEENGYIIGIPEEYSIPFRCLVPLKVDNLLVVGRSASYTSLAAGSARVIPIGMVEGQSAGYAAVYSMEKKMSFRELSKNTELIKEMQKGLRNQGVYLPDFKIESKVSQNWTYPYMVALRRLGLIVTDYKNHYDWNSSIKSISFVKSLRKLIETLPSKNKPLQPLEEIVKGTDKPISYQEAVNILNKAYKNYLKAVGINQENKASFNISVQLAARINAEVNKRQEKILTRGEAFVLLWGFGKKVKVDLKEANLFSQLGKDKYLELNIDKER